MHKKDSIVAIATGSASGGLGVIRISGTQAKDILEKVFLPKHGKNFCFNPRYMHYGSFVMKNKSQPVIVKNNLEETNLNCLNDDLIPLKSDALDSILSFVKSDALDSTLSFVKSDALDNNISDEMEPQFILDEILAVYFPAPFSFTGEDVAEIHAHGGSVLLHTMLEYIISLGIRHAEAGEFTKRAFLNGRIDLAQAEAVAEIIAAPAIEGVRLAAAKLHGVLGKKIEGLREQIEYIRRRLCLAIDFPEEEGECLPPQEFHTLVDILSADISQLIAAYDRAKPWNEGSLVVLAGQVNAGKSSLMNALLGRQRAIVTAEAGTTRDYLEEPSSLAGMPVKLTDTAGLREIAWVIQNSSQEEYGLSLETIERLSHVLNSHNFCSILDEKNTQADLQNQHQNYAHKNEEYNTEEYKNEKYNKKNHDAQNHDAQNHDAQNHAVQNHAVQNHDNQYNDMQNCGKKNVMPAGEKTISPIEAEGIRRSLELMEKADLVFFVFDGTKLLEHLEVMSLNIVDNSDLENAKIIANLMQSELALLPQDVKRICIWNKADIAPLSLTVFHALESLMNVNIFCISANPKYRKEYAEKYRK